MSKKKLFDEDSEEEIALKTENEYAKKYDAWRGKEEMHKLEQKYGPKALSSDASLSSDSEEEDDEPPDVSEETEKQFLKTLALLKTKDPRIYDSSYKFFDDEKEKQPEKESKPKTLTFDDSDDSDDADGNIFSIEKKAEVNVDPDTEKKNKKEGKLKEFLTGQAEHVDDEVEKDLEPLKALWSDPKLSEGEAFLRDYILNKKYLEDDDTGAATDKLRDDEDLEEDEKMVEEQGKFERAYNFRFEEPDEEYLKRFPRTMNYIRPKDERRARKRAEVRARKEEEKKKKMEEIARLKALKLKEIQEKIARIKEVTGNEELAFKEEDIEGDFDPEEHDRRMRAIFDEEYYGDADDEKPVFPDLDEELEIENWEKYEKEGDETRARDDGPHCEDEDFNMDADYDPKQARTNLMEEIQKTLGKKRRNRKKKSKLGELLSTDKPKFVPTGADKTYDEYMEEYYKMDCEDVIGGDLPTRFKYREVVPNDYGLTIEEILLADDKELTQWVPLKKIVRHRPDNVEKGEVKTYAQRAMDVRLKKKVLPSLFKDLPEEPEIAVPVQAVTKKKKKKNKDSKQNEDLDNNEPSTEVNEDTPTEETRSKKKKNKQADSSIKNTNHEAEPNTSEVKCVEGSTDETQLAKSKKKKKKHKETENCTENTSNEIDNKNISGTESSKDESQLDEPKKKKKEKHKKPQEDMENVSNDVKGNVLNNTEINSPEKSERKKKHKAGFVVENVNNVEPSQESNVTSMKKKNEENTQQDNLKRKLDSNSHHIPNKKKKKNKQFDGKGGKKDFNKKKDKFKNKQKDDVLGNPLAKLSDERLKAYGLNPKKYRGFLKYKKF